MVQRPVTCHGILIVCQCGNRFLVPKRQAGERVACTLCGASLPVPAPRSVQQVAAAALEASGQNGSWKGIVDLERKAEASARRWIIPPAAETGPEPSNPRRRWFAAGVIAVVASALVAVGGAAAYSHWGTFGNGSRSLHTSESGGFEVRLPSGLTAKYFTETRRTRPSFTFEGVSFADGTCVGVAYIDLRDDEPLRELPEGIMCYLQREYHGDVVVAEQCDIRLGRHLGRQITYESAGGTARKSYSRWFLVENRLYDVTWIAGYATPSIPAVCEFLDSFRLLSEPQLEVTTVSGPPADAFTGKKRH